MKKLALSMALFAATLSGSGCLSARHIAGVGQAGDKNVTLVQTADLYSFAYLFPVRMVHQFWKCSEAPGSMTCHKVCDAKGSDLTCPAVLPGGQATVSTVK